MFATAPEDDEVLTQYGSLRGDPVFRTRPRTDAHHAMSVTVGRRLADEMAALVGRKPDTSVDVVRHAVAGRFRAAGFVVRRTPSRANPDHASVEWPGRWGDTEAARFDACFGERDG